MTNNKTEKMYWIGLTGGIASGKSTVSEALRKLGLQVIDADMVAHKAAEPGSVGLKAIVSQFGSEILGSDGRLDRRKLGDVVFADPGKLAALEAILHPLIKTEVEARRQALENQGLPFAFYDVPLLYEKKMQEEFDFIVVVSTSEAEQKKRIKSRDRLSDLDIENRLRSQIPLSEKEKSADFVIRNIGSKQDLDLQVQALLTKIQSGIA